MKDPVVVVSAARTPIGKFGGVFKDIPAHELGARAIQEALKRANVRSEEVHKVYMGQVYTAGCGQSPKRQAALMAGIPECVPTVGIETVCTSGMQAVISATHELDSRYGKGSIFVAGGMESMSRAPYLIQKGRPKGLFGRTSLGKWLTKSGYTDHERIELYDTLVEDGLTDAFSPLSMGACAERCVADYSFTREDLDLFALRSHERARNATDEERFTEEIVPIWIGNQIIDQDEGIRRDTSLEKLAKLAPSFGGLLTAGTSAQVSDGAAALVLTTEQYAKSWGLPILGRIIGIGTYAQESQMYMTTPASAVLKALDMAQLTIRDIDLFEINEAFSCVPLAFQKTLDIPIWKINVNGGAIALGHPIGASGARILVTLLYEMERREKKYGVATACNGGGEGRAIVVENPDA